MTVVIGVLKTYCFQEMYKLVWGVNSAFISGVRSWWGFVYLEMPLKNTIWKVYWFYSFQRVVCESVLFFVFLNCAVPRSFMSQKKNIHQYGWVRSCQHFWGIFTSHIPDILKKNIWIYGWAHWFRWRMNKISKM